MIGILNGALVLLVTASTFCYLGIMSLVLWKLAVEGPEVRRILAVPLLPAFLQNLGIPLAILGFAARWTELVVIACLMIAAGMLIASERTIWLHPEVEAPLLRFAIFTLGVIGLIHAVF